MPPTLENDRGNFRENRFGSVLLEDKVNLPRRAKLRNVIFGYAAFPHHNNFMRPFPGMSLTKLISFNSAMCALYLYIPKCLRLSQAHLQTNISYSQILHIFYILLHRDERDHG